MYANNSTASEGSDKVSASDLSTSIKLVSACGAIIKSEPVLEQVKKDLGYPPINSVLVYSVDETQVFKVDVTSTDPEQAVLVANAIAEVAPVKIEGIINGCKVKPISGAKWAWKNWPVKRSEAMKGAVIGFAASVFIICIITLLDTRIKKEDDLERWDYPILGIIPSFTSAQKGGAYASASKGGNK
jgi:capsular polysaccharide biosynthesis protein